MKKFLIIIVLFVAVLLLAGCSLDLPANNNVPQGNGIRPPINDPVACTMEAKLCPDGSAVGRTGPNCEFAPCPGQ